MKQYNSRLAKLPTAFIGLPILHLSDLHADVSGPAMPLAPHGVTSLSGAPH
jgi:hypothetical protein